MKYVIFSLCCLVTTELLDTAIVLFGRGQTLFDVGLSRSTVAHICDRLAAWSSVHYFLSALFCVSLHVLVMAVRAFYRECGSWMGDPHSSSSSYGGAYPMCADGAAATKPRGVPPHTYTNLSWIVWLLMVLLPLLGIIWGFVLNQIDWRSYRRHMQFLRLEFDTKLGMHSPR